MKKPNFFIVGAPKCGTTAMNDFLDQHPHIFMAKKELHFFGKDLRKRGTLSEKEYGDQFSQAGEARVVGEASVWYLYSATAPKEIKAYAPDARILIMLRNPVDLLPSLHSQHLFDGNEDVPDFKTAIRLDEERKKGNLLPRSLGFTTLPSYFDSVRFTPQVRRYLAIFGRENVRVILHEDFSRDVQTVVRDTFRFLGVEPDVPVTFDTINAHRNIRHFSLHRFLKQPSPLLKNIVRTLVPAKKFRHYIMERLFRYNIQVQKREAISPQTRDWIRSVVAEDIRELEVLIGRDLSAWLR